MGVEYYEPSQDPLVMIYHCKIKSVLLLMSKKQEKNNIQSVIEKEIKPIFNKIRRDSIAIINNESLVGDRRQQILEQLGVYIYLYNYIYIDAKNEPKNYGHTEISRAFCRPNGRGGIGN